MNSVDEPNIIDILLIEDSPEEISLMTNILDTKAWNIHIHRVRDGIEAMDYLYKKNKYKNSATPSLILLDLNLPKKDGREILKEIKNDDELKCIPIIILTNSADDKDVIESYDHHVNAYITKPANLDEFEEYIKIFKEFWLNNVKLPKKEDKSG